MVGSIRNVWWHRVGKSVRTLLAKEGCVGLPLDIPCTLGLTNLLSSIQVIPFLSWEPIPVLLYTEVLSK